MSKSNISYTCVNRLTETWYISEGRVIKPPKTPNIKPKYTHDDLRHVYTVYNYILCSSNLFIYNTCMYMLFSCNLKFI